MKVYRKYMIRCKQAYRKYVINLAVRHLYDYQQTKLDLCCDNIHS